MSIRVRLMIVACAMLGVMAGLRLARATPQTLITVTTTADDFTPGNGTCSLREAVYAAAHGVATDACPAGTATDVVELGSGTYTLTRLPAQGEADSEAVGDLDITGTLTLRGSPQTRLGTADYWLNASAALEIWSGQVTIDGITISGVAGDYHSLAINHADLTLRQCSIKQVYTLERLIDNQGRLLIDTCTFTETIGASGVIVNAGEARIANSHFDGNISDVDLLLTLPGSVTTVYSSTFSNSEGQGEPYMEAVITNQGALALDHVTVQGNRSYALISSGVVTLTESLIHQNGTSESIGGGVWINAGRATIDRTTVSKNSNFSVRITAPAQAQIRESAITANSGGVANEGELTISDSTIDHNTPVGIRNAGMLTISDSTISENTGQWYMFGGGIINAEAGRLTLERSLIEGNKNMNGGGIANMGALAISDSTLADNVAYDAMFGGPPVLGGRASGSNP